MECGLCDFVCDLDVCIFEFVVVVFVEVLEGIGFEVFGEW